MFLSPDPPPVILTKDKINTYPPLYNPAGAQGCASAGFCSLLHILFDHDLAFESELAELFLYLFISYVEGGLYRCSS